PMQWGGLRYDLDGDEGAIKQPPRARAKTSARNPWVLSFGVCFARLLPRGHDGADFLVAAERCCPALKKWAHGLPFGTPARCRGLAPSAKTNARARTCIAGAGRRARYAVIQHRAPSVSETYERTVGVDRCDRV